MSVSHEFALYISHLSGLLKHSPSELIIDDKQILTRIASVLRLREGDIVVLFDEQKHARVVVESITKKDAVFLIQEYHDNRNLKPTIDIILPLLKKDALEDALYTCVELGAQNIYLVSTAKTQHVWSEKEPERLTRIMIAAAEQSKNFALPVLRAPKSFKEIVDAHISSESITVYFDPYGQPLLEVMNALKQSSAQHIVCMVGPEGDLTHSEKAMLKEKNVILCRLTPTVIRSKDALMIGLGAVRSLFNEL